MFEALESEIKLHTKMTTSYNAGVKQRQYGRPTFEIYKNNYLQN